MELFTKIDIPASSIRIDYTSRIAFFGSCFADNISAQFAARKFGVLANPFGTVYNPVSIARQIRAIADGKVFGESDVFQDARGLQDVSGKQDARGNQDARGPWYSWDAHGSLSGATREECIKKLNEAAKRTREFLQQADIVFITLGTAFVYYLKDASAMAGNGDAHGRAVANCHRQDPALFERRMITVDEAAQALREIVESICRIKNQDWIATPAARDDEANITIRDGASTGVRDDDRKFHIVFTVSPLRHMGDGAHNNTLSKATLQLAVNNVINKVTTAPSASSGTLPVSYFPSYEIVMDELRDYRFYADDMIHLSQTAEEYIFERMTETYCSEKTRAEIVQVEKFMKGANHRIADPESPATHAFAGKILAQAKSLESSISGLDLSEEITKFSKISGNP
ncbi:GSCFA family protein [Fibrobacter sp. UWCM]|uniref:GSCFA domain-containing protein n=1 Tax=Fibrobacter sp. UWCM TaxID=1896208 RepID=UPI0009135FE7|nr:GSCFA domain-containing protein [Fibrobacter sp. UWCM]SHG84029.1 GSCFA family protein [Fibrobacter sp. UWCM]